MSERGEEREYKQTAKKKRKRRSGDDVETKWNDEALQIGPLGCAQGSSGLNDNLRYSKISGPLSVQNYNRSYGEQSFCTSATNY